MTGAFQSPRSHLLFRIFEVLVTGADRPTPDMHQMTIRSYRREDHDVVARLYTEGLLAGQIAPNDTGADIDNMDDAYFSDPRNHFWVGEVDGKVAGMIGVAADREHTAEVRRLRVDRAYQDSAMAGLLLETALTHCKHHGYLKIVLDTRFDPDVVVDVFDRFGFQHTRTKNLHGKDLLEFYLDLYRQPRVEQDEEN